MSGVEKQFVFSYTQPPTPYTLLFAFYLSPSYSLGSKKNWREKFAGQACAAFACGGLFLSELCAVDLELSVWLDA
jgi:hypothetical protein